jgi:hypothetical protein
MRKEQDKLSWLESQMDELFGKNREPGRATGSCSALNFLGDISKTSAHNLYAPGATNPTFFFYPQKEGKLMIRRLFVLLLFSIVVFGGSASLRPAHSAGPDPCTQDHAAWLTPVLEKMETIKPGMTRWDLLHVFRTEGARREFRMGGAQPVLRETFVSQDSPYFRIDVEFEPNMGVLNQDVIVKVSKPYVQSITTN